MTALYVVRNEHGLYEQQVFGPQGGIQWGSLEGAFLYGLETSALFFAAEAEARVLSLEEAQQLEKDKERMPTLPAKAPWRHVSFRGQIGDVVVQAESGVGVIVNGVLLDESQVTYLEGLLSLSKAAFT